MKKGEFPSTSEELILTQTGLTRIFHWIQFISLTILSLTGFYIYSPGILNISMKVITRWHYLAAYILLANTIGYIYYYIIRKYYHSIIFNLRDIKYLPSFFKYVFFLENSHPYYGKYNPGQKMVFTLWILLIFIMAVTGFTLYYPTKLQFMTFFLGEFSLIRLLHYLGALILSSTILLHLYLVFTENPAKLQAIFTGYIKK